MAVAGRSFPRLTGPEEPFRSMAPDPLERITPEVLAAAALHGLQPKPEPIVHTDHVAPVRASVRDAIETVLALLPAAGRVRFRDLVAGVDERLEVVVRFLACLELYKQGVVDIEQVESFGDLVVRPLQDDERATVDLTVALDEWDDGVEAGIDLGVDDQATTTRRPPLRQPRPQRLRQPRRRPVGADGGAALNEAAADAETRRAIEAIVLAATEPVEPGMLAQLLEVPVARVEEICALLSEEYESTARGFVLVRVAGGYRYQTHPDLSAYVERYVLDGRHARLSAAALETLAIVAYKQPISRAQLNAIRGVNVDATLRTLLQRGYVTELGHEHSPGSPVLFGTTSLFLERLGLDSLSDLPALGDFVPEAGVMEALERGLRVTPEVPVHSAGDEPTGA